MKYYSLKGEKLSVIGMGGADVSFRPQATIKAYRYGLEHGINVIDTAEMYTGSEEIVGQAIKPLDRSKIFLISKVLPSHAQPDQMRRSLETSLRKLGTDYLDLYLLHWREHANLQTVANTMESFKQEGLIRHWGVSNFDLSDMQDLLKVKNGDQVFANEDLYNIASRGVEFDLLPWQKQHQILFLSYSPFHAVGWNRIRAGKILQEIADNHHASPYQVMLAWILRTNFVLPLPKASSANHVKANIAAADLQLSHDELAALDRVYPAPTHKVPLGKI